MRSTRCWRRSTASRRHGSRSRRIATATDPAAPAGINVEHIAFHYGGANPRRVTSRSLNIAPAWAPNGRSLTPPRTSAAGRIVCRRSELGDLQYPAAKHPPARARSRRSRRTERRSRTCHPFCSPWPHGYLGLGHRWLASDAAHQLKGRGQRRPGVVARRTADRLHLRSRRLEPDFSDRP